MSDITEELIYEYWDCPKCGNKGIRGDNYSCNQCGYRRDNSIQFYRKEGREEIVTDSHQKQDFLKGPDWICSFCESLNKAEDTACKGCGANKSDSEKNYFQELEKRKHKDNTNNPEIENSKSSKKWLAVSMGILISLMFFIGYGSCTREVDYVVQEVEWMRILEQKKYSWADRIDWKDQMVGDTPVIYKNEEAIRTYERRQIGTKIETYTETEKYQTGSHKECSTSYESTGSGASKKITKCDEIPDYSNRSITKTREVPEYKDFPIYDTKVYYKSKLYNSIGYKIENDKNNTPKWPKINEEIGEDGKPDIEGERLESLTAVLVKKNKDDTGPEKEKISMKEEPFINKYKLGSTVKMKVMNLGIFSFDKEEWIFDEDKFKEEFQDRLKKVIP